MTNTLKQCGSNRKRVLASSGRKPLIYDLGLMHKEPMMKTGRFPGNFRQANFICHLSGPSQCPHAHQNPSSLWAQASEGLAVVEGICKVQAECISVDPEKPPGLENKSRFRREWTWWHASVHGTFSSRDAHWWDNERPLYCRAAKALSGNYPRIEADTWNQGKTKMHVLLHSPSQLIRPWFEQDESSWIYPSPQISNTHTHTQTETNMPYF